MPAPHLYTKLKLPENAPFELKPSPGKGWGIFAKRDIKKGDLVLSEKPLFVIKSSSPTATELAVLAAFQKLKPEDKKQFLCLRNNGSARYPSMTHAFIDNNMTVSRIVATRPGDNPACGMFILQPRFNHSCTANCKAPFNGMEAICTYAVRDIAAGEELTLNYDARVTFFPPRERHASLGFVCDCPACDIGTPFQELSQIRRTLIRGLMYLQDGEDVDRRRHPAWRSIIICPRLKKMAEDFKVGLTSRFIYQILLLFLMEEEGLLDSFTLKALRRKLEATVRLFRTERNARIARLAMRRKSWLRKFVTAWRLYGREDAGDLLASMYYAEATHYQALGL
ncbi:SET domain [Trichophyton interdigitale]|uniref:SET domain n=1 Tax=Trichophyton interdigitale TaxID=101480 RepID=A0A9P5CY77_9EURO|nr:SET domain [Trichophyton interdigitale]KAF3901181.1 SET domain [Trichophyton interdigitale]KAG8205309.1 SET domain [Trichophyton interdigitale]